MAKLGKVAAKRRGRNPKVKVIAKLEKLFRDCDGFVFVNNKGLNAAEVTELRAKLREKNCTLKVAKNTLIKLAMKNAGQPVDSLSKKLVGPTMVAVGLQDPVSAAKVLREFAESHGEKIEVKAGLLEKRALDKAGVAQLASMPGREELLAMMLGSLQAPAQNLVYALNAAVAKVVYAVSAYQRKLEGSDAA